LCGPNMGVQGGRYFHPSDEDLSPGTPEKKKPLERVPPLYSNSETAIRPAAALVVGPSRRASICSFSELPAYLPSCRKQKEIDSSRHPLMHASRALVTKAWGRLFSPGKICTQQAATRTTRSAARRWGRGWRRGWRESCR
jgi:hypothetical protein